MWYSINAAKPGMPKFINIFNVNHEIQIFTFVCVKKVLIWRVWTNKFLTMHNCSILSQFKW